MLYHTQGSKHGVDVDLINVTDYYPIIHFWDSITYPVDRRSGLTGSRNVAFVKYSMRSSQTKQLRSKIIVRVGIQSSSRKLTPV